MSAKIAVIIVNYRTADLAVDCLASLEGEIQDLPSARAIVVDNASGDDSAARITAAVTSRSWNSWASVLALNENRGFSAGNNAGIFLALKDPDPPEWFLLLNSDTIVRPGALRALLQRGEMSARMGIVGSRLEDPDGTPQHAAFGFPSLTSEFERGVRLGLVSRVLRRRYAGPVLSPEVACKVDWVCGAAMLIRRALLDNIGLLDEGYFLYYEETDFCLRAVQAGWECWHEPRSRVVHLVHQSTGTDPTAPIRRPPPYVFESRRRYFVKNHGLVYAGLTDLAWIAGYCGYLLHTRVRGKRLETAPHALRDFVRHSTLVQGRQSSKFVTRDHPR